MNAIPFDPFDHVDDDFIEAVVSVGEELPDHDSKFPGGRVATRKPTPASAAPRGFTSQEIPQGVRT
jgi:hypothetical protein